MVKINISDYWDSSLSREDRFKRILNLVTDSGLTYLLDFSSSNIRSPFSVKGECPKALVALIKMDNVIFQVASSEDNASLNLASIITTANNISDRIKQVASKSSVAAAVPDIPLQTTVCGNELVISYPHLIELTPSVLEAVSLEADKHKAEFSNRSVTGIRISLSISSAAAFTKFSLWRLVNRLKTMYGVPLSVITDLGADSSAGVTLDITEMLKYKHLDYNLLSKINFWSKLPKGLVGSYQHFLPTSNLSDHIYYKSDAEMDLSNFAVYRGIKEDVCRPENSCLIFDMTNTGDGEDNCMLEADYKELFNGAKRPKLTFERFIIPIVSAGYGYEFLGKPNKGDTSFPRIRDIQQDKVATVNSLSGFTGTIRFSPLDPTSLCSVFQNGQWVDIPDAEYIKRLFDSYDYTDYAVDALNTDIQLAAKAIV